MAAGAGTAPIRAPVILGSLSAGYSLAGRTFSSIALVVIIDSVIVQKCCVYRSQGPLLEGTQK